MKQFTAAFLAVTFLASPVFAVAKVQEVEKNVWLIEDHSLPIVTVKIVYVGAGAASDPAGKEGLASFTSQMLDEGAGDMDSLAFNRKLEDSAIRLGVDANEDMLGVTLQTLSEFKGNAFDLLTVALSKPRFDTEAVERIRASIISDLKQAEENPGYIASRKWKEIAFAGHPYEHPRRGTLTSVAAITAEDLKAFAGSHLACDAKEISVVGDITADEVKQWLKKAFTTQACAAPAATVADIKIPDGGAAPIWVEKPVPQTVVQASLPGIKRNDPNYYAAHVMVHILGGGDSLTSRLGKAIRDKRGLAYYVGTQIENLDHSAMIIGYFATRSVEAQTALGLFLGELKAMSEHGVTQAELDDAKHYLTGSFPLEIDNENALAEYVILMQHFGLGIDYLDKRNGLISAVTLPQVNAQAKALLSAPPLIVMVGQKPGAAKP